MQSTQVIMNRSFSGPHLAVAGVLFLLAVGLPLGQALAGPRPISDFLNAQGKRVARTGTRIPPHLCRGDWPPPCCIRGR